jgi:hypothetical protein
VQLGEDLLEAIEPRPQLADRLVVLVRRTVAHHVAPQRFESARPQTRPRKDGIGHGVDATGCAPHDSDRDCSGTLPQVAATQRSPISDEERVRLLEQLAREHKLLRDRLSEMTRFAEAAVARAVVAEKHVRNLQDELAATRAHVDALLSSRTMRALAPVRRAYGWVRSRGGHP